MTRVEDVFGQQRKLEGQRAELIRLPYSQASEEVKNLVITFKEKYCPRHTTYLNFEGVSYGLNLSFAFIHALTRVLKEKEWAEAPCRMLGTRRAV